MAGRRDAPKIQEPQDKLTPGLGANKHCATFAIGLGFLNKLMAPSDDNAVKKHFVDVFSL